MKKKLNRVVWCDRGFFPIFYGFCPSKKAWNREMKRLGSNLVDLPYPSTPASCTVLRKRKKNKDTKTSAIVTLAERHDTADITGIAGLFAHESTHVWQAVRESMGEDEPSSEFEAYSIEFIFGNLFHAWLETRAPRKIAA